MSKCPKCGEELECVALTSNPPRFSYQCKCGYRYDIEEKKTKKGGYFLEDDEIDYWRVEAYDSMGSRFIIFPAKLSEEEDTRFYQREDAEKWVVEELPFLKFVRSRARKKVERGVMFINTADIRKLSVIPVKKRPLFDDEEEDIYDSDEDM